MSVLATLDTWPVPQVAGAIIGADGGVESAGDANAVFRLASIAKVFTAAAILIAVEEETVSLDDAVGPPGATLRDLLAHCGGYGFDNDTVLAQPQTKRIYSNTGIEVAARHVAAAAGFAFADYLHEAILGPLELHQTSLRGSPAAEVYSSIADLARFFVALRSHELLSPPTTAAMTTAHRPELDGVVPGFGRQTPNPWGLGVEIRGTKSPHWTSPHNSERTWGHFGGAGTFAWHDPTVDISLLVLTDRPFDEWALPLWPQLGTEALRAAGVTTE